MNMNIWNQVEKTDTRHTKPVNFGRKFTAIDAHWQIKRATEVFGPIGTGWGVSDSKYEVLVLDQNDPHYNLLQFTATLWYIHEGTKGSFDIAADIELFADTRNGWKRTEDSHKKVRTDALTKGLSWLGFNADVFLGKFDDNKYIQRLKQEEAEADRAASAPVRTQAQADIIDNLCKSIRWDRAKLDKYLTSKKMSLDSLSKKNAEVLITKIRGWMPAGSATDDQLFEIDALVKDLKWDGARLNRMLASGGMNLESLTEAQANSVYMDLITIKNREAMPV